MSVAELPGAMLCPEISKAALLMVGPFKEPCEDQGGDYAPTQGTSLLGEVDVHGLQGTLINLWTSAAHDFVRIRIKDVLREGLIDLLAKLAHQR